MSLKISFLCFLYYCCFSILLLPAGVQVLCLYTYETVDSSQAFCIIFFLVICFFVSIMSKYLNLCLLLSSFPFLLCQDGVEGIIVIHY